ncbi:MFS transporter [Novosphingobium terrae]|uniref:MFS transporter n=1 Tax=Novosphingobium terrae TaxID=2726189 RepID=UPI00197D1ACD|nr:MFS transporter [Novosphingobium terrae]
MTASRSPSAFATLMLCFSIIGLEGYDIQAFGVAAPRMMAQLGIGASAQGAIASAAMVGLIIGAFLSGSLSRHFGLRTMLAGATLLFGLCSIGTAFVPGVGGLVAVRCLAGVGFGSALPIVLSIASAAGSHRHRSLIVTIAFCGLPAGAAVVALYARAMGGVVDWHMLFISGGIVPSLLAPLVFLCIPHSAPPQRAATASATSDLFGDNRLLSTLLVWLIFATTLLATYLMLNWLPSLVVAMGLSAQVGSSAAFAFNLASILGAILLSLVVDRLGFRWPLVAAYTLFSLTIVLLAFSHTPDAVLLFSALAGLLIVGPQCAIYALIPRIYPVHARVLGTSAAVGVGRVGSIVGPLIAGQLRAGGLPANDVFLSLAPVPLIAAVAVLILGSRATMTNQPQPAA